MNKILIIIFIIVFIVIIISYSYNKEDIQRKSLIKQIRQKEKETTSVITIDTRKMSDSWLDNAFTTKGLRDILVSYIK